MNHVSPECGMNAGKQLTKPGARHEVQSQGPVAMLEGTERRREVAGLGTGGWGVSV